MEQKGKSHKSDTTSTLRQNELSIKVFERYKTIGPEVDKRHFVKDELVMAFGSYLEWDLLGGPTQWDDDKRPQNREFISTLHSGETVNASQSLISAEYLQNKKTESKSVYK